jgi:hypothetical protein
MGLAYCQHHIAHHQRRHAAPFGRNPVAFDGGLVELGAARLRGVYAQVDSANTLTTYGGVLEDHEITGGAYNNVSDAVSTLGVTGAVAVPAGGAGQSTVPDKLPDRP